MLRRRAILPLTLLLTLALTGCGLLPAAATPTPGPPTPTSVPPTPTPMPGAALVNQERITLVEYEAEVQRYEAAQAEAGTELASLGPYRQQVLQALIDLELLAQAAVAAGDDLGPDELSREIDRLAEELGGSEAMGAWLAAQGYDLDSFGRALRRELLAQLTIERVAGQLIGPVEQVHARHLLVASREEAEALRGQIEAGADLGELAVTQSLDLSTRVGGGDLGWFPRGVLTQPAVEEAAFALAPDEVSQVVESDLGYHLIEVIEREVRPLSANDLRRLRQAAVEEWLAAERQRAAIEILIEP
ncbi:MAG TPA: peptidylprolyl isomerase [Anaerolineales bacterium]